MAGEVPDGAHRQAAAMAEARLDSWKAIAAYLNRDVTTVRRWEKREGLPVHRHVHDRRDSVYAYGAELDAWLVGRGARLAENGASPGRAVTSARLTWLAIAVAAAAGLSAPCAMRWRPPQAPAPQARFAVAPPAGYTFRSMTLSPDGRHLAFTASSQGEKRMLWVRPLDSLTATPLAGTDDAAYPFWSPDSRSLGFFAHGKLRTVAAAGGTPQIVCDAPAGRGGTWSRAGLIVFAPSADAPLFRVPAAGGRPVPVTTLDAARERSHMWPEFLPDDRHVVFLADSSQFEHHAVYVAAIDRPGRKQLLRDATNAAYVSEGYLLYARERRLIAHPFDTERLELIGQPVTVAPSVREHFDVEHLFDFTASDTGVLTYQPMPSLEARLEWRDRASRRASFLDAQALYADPTFSPDGRRLAVDVFDPMPSERFGFALGGWTSDIWLFDAVTGTGTRLTFDPAADFEPVWSPDGTQVAFSSNRSGTLDLYLQSTGGGPAHLLLHTPRTKHAQSWSPDGRFIVYASLEPKTRWDLWLLPLAGDRRPQALLQSEFSENQATIAPNGRWIAYTSNETGRNEVYVQSFPALDRKWQISTGGGGDARWRADGRELFYIGEDGYLTSVDAGSGRTFEPGIPTRMFDTGNSPGWSAARNHYDVAPDGRFLVMAPVDDGRTSSFTVVVNWRAPR